MIEIKRVFGNGQMDPLWYIHTGKQYIVVFVFKIHIIEYRQKYWCTHDTGKVYWKMRQSRELVSIENN